MSSFVVHSIPGSPYGRAVLATLEEKGADYRLAPVAPGAHRGDPHLSRHPFARIPVLEHEGFMLYETQAILRYLDRVLPTPSLTPAHAQSAARMDQLLAICDWYLFQGVGNVIVFHRVVGPRVMGLAPDEAAIAAAMPKAHVVVDELARLLGKQPYFAGEQMSLADLMLACHLDMFSITPEWTTLTDKTPALLAWLDRMNHRSSLKATTWDQVAAMGRAA